MMKYLLIFMLMFLSQSANAAYPDFTGCDDASFPLGSVRMLYGYYAMRAVPPGPGGSYSLMEPCGNDGGTPPQPTYIYVSPTDSLGCSGTDTRNANGDCAPTPACAHGLSMQCDAGGANCSCKNWCKAESNHDYVSETATSSTGGKSCVSIPGQTASRCSDGGTPLCNTKPATDYSDCPVTATLDVKYTNQYGNVICKWSTYETGAPIVGDGTSDAASGVAAASGVSSGDSNAAASSVATNPANSSQVTGEAGTLAGERAAICAGLTGAAAEACAVAIGVSIGNSTGSGAGNGSGSGGGDGSDFCEAHPNSLACKDGTFSGACDIPVSSECALDPVICAIAQEDLVSDCSLAQQYVTDHEKSDLGDQAIAGTDDGTTNNPAKEENRTHVSMSTLIPTPAPRFSRSPLVDVTYASGTAYPVKIPWSNYNVILSIIGQIGVVCSLIAAVGIVFL